MGSTCGAPIRRDAQYQQLLVNSFTSWFIHPFFHSIHISLKPNLRNSSMNKGKTNSRCPRSTTQTEGRYTLGCGLIPQGMYNCTEIYFQVHVFNHYIFFIWNRKFKWWKLIHCSRFVIRSARMHICTHTKPTCSCCLDIPKNSPGQCCQNSSSDLYSLLSVSKLVC